MADHHEVILLDFWPSQFGMRVRLALAEKGIEYQYKEENLFVKSPVLLKLNPVHKKIPVLIHKGRPICESLVIVQYIDEAWSNKSPSLLPSDPYKHAIATFWADYVDKKVYDCGKRLCMSKGEEQEKAKKELMEGLKLLEQELGEKKYFGGENFGFVDVAFLPFYSRFYTYEKFGNFNIEEEFPRLVGWAKMCMEKESVKKTLPDQHKVYEFVLELQKKLGIE